MHIKTKLISTAAFVMGSWMLAAPAYATCGVNGYWGSECGPQTPEPAPTTPGDITNTLTGGDSTSTATGVGVGVGVGVGTGGNGYGGQGGAGGSSTATATGTGGAGGQGGAGGSATATGGSVTGSGNSSSDSSAVAGVTGSGNSSSNSGVTGSGNSSVTNRTTVNNTNKTRIKHAASTAAPALIQNTGNTLCDGGGSFSASVQTFGWGISAANKKGDRFCQLLATFGPQVAGAYIAEKDNAAKRAMLNNGAAITSRQAASPDARAVVRCPAGSAWDGKGCWAKNLKAVSR